MRNIARSACMLALLGACSVPGAIQISDTAGVIRPGDRQSIVPGGPSGPASGSRSIGEISLGSFSGGIEPRAVVQGPPAEQADAYARNFLNQIQPRSFARGIELCGYFYIDAAGQIAATAPIAGTLATCTQPAPGAAVFASYHTHGAYDGNYDNEVPSVGDLQGDFSFGIDGYVSTPGGRVWRIEADSQIAIQICGLRCVSVDPGFIPRDETGVRPTYTIAQLRQR